MAKSYRIKGSFTKGTGPILFRVQLNHKSQIKQTDASFPPLHHPPSITCAYPMTPIPMPTGTLNLQADSGLSRIYIDKHTAAFIPEACGNLLEPLTCSIITPRAMCIDPGYIPLSCLSAFSWLNVRRSVCDLGLAFFCQGELQDNKPKPLLSSDAGCRSNVSECAPHKAAETRRISLAANMRTRMPVL